MLDMYLLINGIYLIVVNDVYTGKTIDFNKIIHNKQNYSIRSQIGTAIRDYLSGVNMPYQNRRKILVPNNQYIVLLNKNINKLLGVNKFSSRDEMTNLSLVNLL